MGSALATDTIPVLVTMVGALNGSLVILWMIEIQGRRAQCKGTGLETSTNEKIKRLCIICLYSGLFWHRYTLWIPICHYHAHCIIQGHKKTVIWVLIAKRLHYSRSSAIEFAWHILHTIVWRKGDVMFKCHLSQIRSWPVNKPSDLPFGVVKQNIQLPCEGHVLLLQRRQWRCCNEGHRSLSNSFRGSWHNDRRILKFILNIAHNLSSWLFDYIQWNSQLLYIFSSEPVHVRSEEQCKASVVYYVWGANDDRLWVSRTGHFAQFPPASTRHNETIDRHHTSVFSCAFSEVFTPETARCLGACALTKPLKRV